MPVLTFPWFAFAGALAAAGVVIAHLIASRPRAPRPLPTARFIVRAQQRSAALEKRPRDVALLALRALALLLAGVALARPILPPREREPASITIVDPAGAADIAEVRDSVRTVAGEDGLVVLSADSVRELRVAAWSGGDAIPVTPGRNEALTGALIVALRRTAELSSRGHRVRLNLVSALTDASLDSATFAVRALWNGAIRIVPVAAAPVSRTVTPALNLRGATDDPLRAGIALLPRSADRRVRLVRDSLAPADTVALQPGDVLVYWPRDGYPPSFVPHAPDTVAGLWMGDYTWVAPLIRRARSAGSEVATTVRWLDGDPAVIERSIGEGCLREVAIEVPDAGDAVLSRGLQNLLVKLGEPCGGTATRNELSRQQRARLAGTGPIESRLDSAGMVPTDSWLVRALLFTSLLALAAEMLLRRKRA